MVAVFVFLMLRLTPGDPAAIIAGDNASEAQIAAIRDQLGLSQPIAVQFLIWLGKLLQGDLGQSFFFKAEVVELIGQRVGPTLALATVTMIITVAGRGAARRARRVQARQLDRPPGDGLLGDRLLGAGVRARLSPDLGLRDRDQAVPGPGLPQHHRRPLAVPPPSHPARDHAVRDLHRADRPDHARERARGPGRGLHPHRATPRACPTGPC